MTNCVKTELGFLPKEWEIVRLGEIGFAYSGLVGKTKEHFGKGNAKYISYKNVFDNYQINCDKLEFVEIAKDENQNLVEFGDIFFTISSETPQEVGMCSVLLQEVENTYLNSFCFGFRADKNVLDPKFAAYHFRNSFFRKEMLKLAQGSTRYNISKNEVLNMQIPLPPLKEQKKIAEILSLWDNGILTLERLILKKQNLKKGLMQRLLKADKFSKWKEFCLGEIAEISSGGTPSKENENYWKNGTIKWLGSSVCKNLNYIDEITNYITQEGLNHSSAKIFKNGTTLIALVGATIGKVAFLNFEASTNQNIAGIYPKNTAKLDCLFLFYSCLMLYREFKKLSSDKFKMANLSFVKSLKIHLPPLKEQKKIAEILNTQDKEISLLQEKLKLLKTQKKALMQQILNAKIRVKI